MHNECYCGRVASLDEWRALLRWWRSEEDKLDLWPEPLTCPACGASGKGA